MTPEDDRSSNNTKKPNVRLGIRPRGVYQVPQIYRYVLTPNNVPLYQRLAFTQA